MMTYTIENETEEAGARRHYDNLMGNFPFAAFQTLQAQKQTLCVSENGRLIWSQGKAIR